jgi:hypothetical protein
MLAIAAVSLLLLVGMDRIPSLALALLSLLVFVAVEPALLASGLGAFVAAGAFLFVAIQWLCPALLDGVRPFRVAWITPRFTLALAYA